MVQKPLPGPGGHPWEVPRCRDRQVPRMQFAVPTAARISPGVMAQEFPGELPEGWLLAQRGRQLAEVLRAPRNVAAVQMVLLVKARARHFHCNIHSGARLRHRARGPAANRAHGGRRVKAQRPLQVQVRCLKTGTMTYVYSGQELRKSKGT